MTPRVSIVIAWRNRAELGTTLAANLDLVAAWDAEIVIVNYGGDPAALEALLAPFENAPVRLLEVAADGFNKSRALNLGAHVARGPYLLLLDADVILTDFDVERAIAEAHAGGWLTLGKVRESVPPPGKRGQIAEYANSFDIVLGDGRRARVETKRHYFDDGARSCPGIMFLRRADLLAIGGFNSQLVGWGWEDVDVHVRLGLALGRPAAGLGEGVHLSHGDEHRFFIGDSPGANNQRNQHICMRLYDAGQFEGSYAQDVAAFSYRAAQPA
ncbi:glycosyltransferase family 2 protein [Massilia pseudoviolaceinigra]|uniref:glycosyltransferase family 2 protein n=1 Tax=Massilia pseudoviolaceinigra TaxID=3057165 RepID=UPI002796BCDC|nr:galactosyltransferase-related protein [Massilia sp. CCM 9206]MDQ1923601.1 galactosyltransferase-related protein [Massilia sp. CCM 9206]